MLRNFFIKILTILLRWVKSEWFYETLAVIASFSVFFEVTYEVLTKDEITIYDKIIVDWVNTIASVNSTTLAIFITNIITVEILTPIIIATLVILLFKRLYKESLFFIVTNISGLVFFHYGKLLFNRERPTVGSPIIMETGLSYPSGHSTMAMCYFGTILFLVGKHMRPSFAKKAIMAGLILLILSIGMSRVYLGVHYPSDIMGGFALGAFIISLCALVYNGKHKSTTLPSMVRSVLSLK